MIGSEILKTVGLVGLEGLLNLLLQKAEGLADFGEILVFNRNPGGKSETYRFKIFVFD